MNKNILLWIIKSAIIVSFFTPLFVSGSFVFPFVFPKTMVFQILVEVAFFAWLILAVENPEFRPKRSRIVLALGLFLAVAFIASFLGVDFSHSFWSNYERMTGLVTMLHYFAFFLVLTTVLKTKKDWLFIFDAFVIAGLSLSFVALGQKLNIEGLYLSGVGRVSSTFGNPAYLAAYLLFLLFFIAFMFFQRQSKGAKIYYALAFLFNLLIFYWTETRGALLAFGVSIVLFMFALVLWPKENQENRQMANFKGKIKKIAMAVLIAFVIFASLVYLSKDSAWVKNSSTLSRLVSISATEATSQTRLLAWKMSWQGFKEKPVLGWGWENYNIVFNKYYDPDLFPVENWFDRAHNIIFDTLISVGFLGFVAFLWLFVVLFITLWRAFKKGRIDFLNASLFAILPVAYLAQDFFVFDMLFSYMPFFLFLAFVNWIGKEEAKMPAVAKAIRSNAFLKIAVGFAFIFILYFVSLRPAMAGYWGIKAITLQKAGVAKMQEAFEKSLGYGTFGRFEVRLQMFDLTKNILASYQTLPESEKKAAQDFILFALAEGDKTLDERSIDTRYRLLVGQLNMMSAQFLPSGLAKADQILQEALKQSPRRQLTHFALGELKLREGKSEEAISYFKKAMALNEKAQEPYFNLAYVYFSLGDKANGEKMLAEIEARFGKDATGADKYRRIATILVSLKNIDDAIFYLEKAIALEPKNYENYTALATVYAEKPDKQKAKETALKAAEINPSIQKTVDEFIKSLEQ